MKLGRACRGHVKAPSIALRAFFLLAWPLTGCQHALPEQGTAAAALYQARCGSCHRAYAPSSLTATMWDTQVGVMEPKIAEAGQRPLTADEERTIIEYLKRNAGG